MKDPTLQKTGPMTAYVQSIIMYNTINLSSFPHDAPPPAWQEGNQWINLIPQAKYIQPPVGKAVGILKVVDRSNQCIPVNKGYSFTCETNVQANLYTYFELHGTAEGSTCLPGVGLANLITNPNGITYIKPQNFDGSFTISWLSPNYVGWSSCSITYAPAQDGFPTSRLIYDFRAVGLYLPPKGIKENLSESPVILGEISHPYDTVVLSEEELSSLGIKD